MSEVRFEIVEVKSGVKSLRQLENLEIFHPGIGPVAEAHILHVRQQRLVERLRARGRLVIWDVGLGAAANALAAVSALENEPGEVEIHSFDKTAAPLHFALEHSEQLEYLLPYRPALEVLAAVGNVQISSRIRWYFHRGDFREEMRRSSLPLPQAVFYDPYSPRGNVEMWTLEHFRALHARLAGAEPYLLSNYTRSTLVRVTWLMAGFFVGVGAAIGEKEETTLASNCPSLIEKPLGQAFLKKAYSSHASAPLRGDVYRIEPIEEEDFAQLVQAPHFLVGSSLESL